MGLGSLSRHHGHLYSLFLSSYHELRSFDRGTPFRRYFVGIGCGREVTLCLTLGCGGKRSYFLRRSLILHHNLSPGKHLFALLHRKDYVRGRSRCCRHGYHNLLFRSLYHELRSGDRSTPLSRDLVGVGCGYEVTLCLTFGRGRKRSSFLRGRLILDHNLSTCNRVGALLHGEDYVRGSRSYCFHNDIHSLFRSLYHELSSLRLIPVGGHLVSIGCGRKEEDRLSVAISYLRVNRDSRCIADSDCSPNHRSRPNLYGKEYLG